MLPLTKSKFLKPFDSKSLFTSSKLNPFPPTFSKFSIKFISSLLFNFSDGKVPKVSKPIIFLELGVYKAASLLRFATFRDSLENNYSRKIIGLDRKSVV